MPYFSKTSKERLSTCDCRLIRLFNEIIKKYDCTIICGHRCKSLQNSAFRKGASKVRFPYSKHNSDPSKAVDVAPYNTEKKCIEWTNRHAFIDFAEIVFKEARKQEVCIRWGGDWDRDGYTKDETFIDMPHYELIIGINESFCLTKMAQVIT